MYVSESRCVKLQGVCVCGGEGCGEKRERKDKRSEGIRLCMQAKDGSGWCVCV